MPGATPSPLDEPVTDLRGVGPERAAQLAKLGIRTVRELVGHRPRRYEDRRQIQNIGSLQSGDTAAICGAIVAMGVKTWRHRRRSVFECIVDDGSGRLHCRWWNMPYMQQYFEAGQKLFVYGRVSSIRPRSMDHPETEEVNPAEEEGIHLRRIVPVYPLTEGLSQRWLRALIHRALQQYATALEEPSAPKLPADMPSLAQAIRSFHFPADSEAAGQGRRALALRELIQLQAEIRRRRQRLEANALSRSCVGDNHMIRPFLQRLGFVLTKAQTGVLRELRRDLGGGRPMRRLLQGDVGSGKTVVAACTALMVLESRFSVALMAPTEILAGQHYATFQRWFEPLGVRVHLLTGSRNTRSTAASRAPSPGPNSGAFPTPSASPELVIGTHALLEAGFQLEDLGLVIIDEQHKFGVAQREKLVRKGHYPHLLVMTATPIPRTLGLTLYGDLDLSTIDALPPGRGGVKTFIRSVDRLPKVWSFVRKELDQGRQAYFVYPRVEQDEGTTIKTVTAEGRRIARDFAPHRVGILHGQLSSAERDAVMGAFRRAELSVLVASSVIEVGVDIPNATLMIIENAERFGLAQLHQLRGRIGRGAHESYCVLVADLRTAEARQRLEVLERTQDGFQIAEEDLRLRGPGELLGREQSGLPSFRFADLATDLDLVELARQLARE